MLLLALLALAGCHPDPPGTVPEPPDDEDDTVGVAAPAAANVTFVGPPPTNLVMISVDTMRRDHVGRYDDGASLTPFLDARMDEGFAADDMTGCSNWTVAGTACALAGASNLDRAEARGMVPILMDGPLAPIPQPSDPNGPTPLLPSFLRVHGFTSLLVTANGYFSNAHGNAQGYDTLLYPGPVPIGRLWDEAEAHLLAQPPAEPWLIHLHAFEPHAPYLPDSSFLEGLDDLLPVPFDLTTMRGQEAAITAVYANPPTLTPDEIASVKEHVRLYYAGEIRRLDAGVEAVWAELDAAGYLDDALVVFWTDHGEALFDPVVNEHGKLLYRNENDVVAWYWAKNIVPGAATGPSEQIDIAPTILAALGFPLAAEMTGIPLGDAPEDRIRHALTDAYKGPVQTVQQGRYKLQFRWGLPDEDAPTTLGFYDVVADPGELVNLYDPAVAPSAELLALWPAMQADIEKATPWIAEDPRSWEVTWPEGLSRPGTP
ncbi:MAG: sulfatase-like hydrolase/transferase [Deltaproteobacteria bacterium]|nr:sulfatase-like hydrolase/transferase [Deltaproteobacteria bacterium]